MDPHTDDHAPDAVRSGDDPAGRREVGPFPARPSRTGLFALAFGSGFSVLTIEIAGARLIAPVFGLSVVPWTAVIGVILAALAVGSHLGGRLADAGRVPLGAILMAAGVTCALPVVGADLPWAARALLGFIPGAVASALVLFAPPVLCLGAVVPYLVQADTDSLGAVGRRAGDLSAVATAGSIAGSFATGFVLLPAFPLPILLSGVAAALLLMAALSWRVLGGGPSDRRLVAAAGGVGLLGLLASGSPDDTLHAGQTLYSSVRVTERTWAGGRTVRELWQNGGSSSAEDASSGAPTHTYAIATMAYLEPVLERSRTALVLGGAALTLPVAFVGVNNALRVDVVEIDPVVTELAAEYFVFGREPRPNIHVVHDDGRVFLRGSDAHYDLVYLDVFDHLLTVPWTMVTAEALADMAARLGPEGVFAANVLSPLAGPGTAFLERFRTTLESVFSDVRFYRADADVRDEATQNLIVVASVRPGVVPDIDAPLTDVPASGRPFTDRWAPVEFLQAKVFVQGLTWN